MRWYVTAAVVVDLVGGRPAEAKKYLETRREEIEAHHSKYHLTPGYNHRSIPITQRVEIAEPAGEEQAQRVTQQSVWAG